MPNYARIRVQKSVTEECVLPRKVFER